MTSSALILSIALCFVGTCSADDADDQKRWPLIFAAGEGDVKRVESLLADGIDVHQQSKDGESALHVVSIKGSLPTARALLKAGAEVDARTPRGSTFYMTPTVRCEVSNPLG